MADKQEPGCRTSRPPVTPAVHVTWSLCARTFSSAEPVMAAAAASMASISQDRAWLGGPWGPHRLIHRRLTDAERASRKLGPEAVTADQGPCGAGRENVECGWGRRPDSTPGEHRQSPTGTQSSCSWPQLSAGHLITVTWPPAPARWGWTRERPSRRELPGS